MEIRWDLSIIYDSFESKALKDDLKRVKELINTTIEKYNTCFFAEADAKELICYHVNVTNELNSLFLKLIAYARLQHSTNMESEEPKKLQQELEELMPCLNKINMPFLRYLNGLDNLEDIIAQSPLLQEHSFILKDLQEQAKHLLSDDMEQLLMNMQQTGSYAFEELHNTLINTLTVDVSIGSETKSMPLSVARNMAYAQSQDLRKAAYEAELKAYRKISSASASCLNSIKREAITIAETRGFSSPLEMTLADARMDKPTLDAMFESIIEVRPKFRQYLRKKAQLLSHPSSLPFYELYAPMGQFDMHFTYEEAKDLIVKTFSGFSTELGDFAEKAFENGWIDLEPRDKKQSGVYCCNIHNIGQSRIFSNFTGTFYDITTLAHELGHGYHNEKLNTQTILNTDYTMPMAETASIFCQTLLTDELLKNASKETRFAILENDLMNYTQILIEILARYTFETNLFEKRKNGPLSVNELNRLLLDAQEFAYGDGMSEERHKYMWICKPHYYFPDFHFYNFPYPYGLLFSKGLYYTYLQEGKAFVPKFEQLLTATGSNSVRGVFELLGKQSDDIQFYRNALSLILKEIEEFLAL